SLRLIPLPGIATELAHRTPDHRWLCTGCPALLPRQVTHAYFCVGQASAREFEEHLRIDHRPTRLQAVFTHKRARIEFKGTVDVPYPHAQHQPYQYLPAPGVELAYPGVLPIETIAQHGIVRLQPGKEALQIANSKLPIRVHKKDQIFGTRRK